ncbi:MAG: hypothetical protein IPM07_00290 [Anaerolineales bacterium]|nr:hypothetical protein [Anaerolineales bacterium]
MPTVAASDQFSIWDLAYVGFNLISLRQVSARTPIRPKRAQAVSVPDRLRLLQSDLEALELSKSEMALLEELNELLDRLESPERPNQLGSDASSLRRMMKRIEQVLSEEARSRSVFVVQRSREGEIQHLLMDPTGFLGIPQNGPLQLTITGREDFEEAARCYSVGFTAASIMFMLRGTEETLRSYYEQITKQPPKKGINWGSMLNVLQIPVLKCPQQLVDKLKILLEKRTQAMHPKERNPSDWGQEAAKHILDECRQAIQMMVVDLNTRDQ